jgi:hypothetical protein
VFRFADYTWLPRSRHIAVTDKLLGASSKARHMKQVLPILTSKHRILECIQGIHNEMRHCYDPLRLPSIHIMTKHPVKGCRWLRRKVQIIQHRTYTDYLRGQTHPRKRVPRRASKGLQFYCRYTAVVRNCVLRL